MKSIYVVPF